MFKTGTDVKFVMEYATLKNILVPRYLMKIFFTIPEQRNSEVGTSSEVDSGCPPDEEDMGPIILADKKVGVCIGHLTVFGATEQECGREVKEFVKEIAKCNIDCPWLNV